MGAYSSVPTEDSHTIVAYKSALNMAKNRKDSNEIVGLINKNKVNKDDNKVEVLSILNNVMLEISLNLETTEDDILLLDKIIHEIRDNN